MDRVLEGEKFKKEVIDLVIRRLKDFSKEEKKYFLDIWFDGCIQTLNSKVKLLQSKALERNTLKLTTT